MRAAFGGFIGKKMKKNARRWAAETPNIKTLPEKSVMSAMETRLKK